MRTLEQGGQNAQWGRIPVGKGAPGRGGMLGEPGQVESPGVTRSASKRTRQTEEAPSAAPSKKRLAATASGVGQRAVEQTKVEEKEYAAFKAGGLPPVAEKKGGQVVEPRPQGPLAVDGGKSTSALMQSRADQAESDRSSLSGLKRPSMEEEVVERPPTPPSPTPDIDSADIGDPLQCSEYAQAIYEHYMAEEDSARADPNYMASVQTVINCKMRDVLIDWIVGVHLKFKLMPNTLYLTVNLIDRYLAKVQVGRKRLQLVGISALMIAAKYEETWALQVWDFIQICDHAYTREDILAMEKSMLITLGWKLTVPTTYIFLSRFLKAAGSQTDKHMSLVAAYLAELTLLSYDTLKYRFSEIAAAAVYVARRAAKVPDSYPYALQKHSTYRLADLTPCVEELVELMKKAKTSLTKSVHWKYSHGKYHSVSTETQAPQL